MVNEWFAVRFISKDKGKGGFAIKHIPKGTQIIEYKGKHISKQVSEKKAGKHRRKKQVWIFELNDHTDIDASRGGNEARFINHSDTPNCEAINYDGEEIWIEAIQDIKPGEELTYDYEFEDEDDEDYSWYKKPKGPLPTNHPDEEEE